MNLINEQQKNCLLSFYEMMDKYNFYEIHDHLISHITIAHKIFGAEHEYIKDMGKIQSLINDFFRTTSRGRRSRLSFKIYDISTKLKNIAKNKFN